MRKYEVIFILKPAEEETINTQIEKFEKLIAANGGTIEKTDRWGKRRLAYSVKDFADGYYCILYFTAEPNVVAELERVLKISDEVLKHMVVKEDE